MDAKTNILKDTFQMRFSHEQFGLFVKEFFEGRELKNPDRDNTNIPNEYKYTVESYRHVASYNSDNETLDIFTVKLQRGRSVERARSMQRSFISKLLTNMIHDAAVVAFYTDDDPRWRLSFIRLDYELAAGRIKRNVTPAKRYSYLVGENEPCHTAMEQLYPIFYTEGYHPTLDKIEEAFSVERVTKDFFEKYKEKYHDLKDHLDSSEVFNEEAARCGFTSEQFAKKLMGQLAFLYFLQKKGWLGIRVLPHRLTKKEYEKAYWVSKGSRVIIPQIYKPVAEDEYRLDVKAMQSLSDDDADIAASCFKPDDWGKGEKEFVRHLFTSCKSNNFFDDFLEPMFYEALNQNRGKNYFYKRFNCKIPFLNGGLFEPLESYDWRYSRFDIPNDIFSNKETKGERDADGILDIFDRYNFTMNEDEPLEREVAVDPEMLGKIFENLLDAKDRKSKGAFYTPREIVHYMCAESLINYLVGKTGIPYDDMKIFIVDGEFLKDEDYWSKEEQRKLPQSVFDKLDEIDKALETIRVADPAVGSGAFPLGMLSEIVKARHNISYYMASKIRYPFEELRRQSDERRRFVFEPRNLYRLKWETIQNCIFAVDIEASAVDIAKLRLWLSLVVEEELDPTEEEKRLGIAIQKDPHPLPNLDYNIMCGNSLIDEFEGIKLFDDSLLDKKEQADTGKDIAVQMSIFADNMHVYLDDLRHEQERLFGEQTPSVKNEIKKKIDNIIDSIIRAKLQRDNNIDGLRKYEEVLKQKTKPYFLWKLEFARVFRENGGFDVVIGNPPYGLINKKQNKHSSISATEVEQNYFKNSPLYQPAKGGMLNIYRLFVCLSHSLLKEQGNFSLIFPMAYMCDLSAANLRKFISLNAKTLYVEAFPERDDENRRVFEAVKMSVCILGVERTAPQEADVFPLRINSDRFVDMNTPVTNIMSSEIRQIDPNGMAIPVATQEELGLFVKMTSDCDRLGEISKCYTGEIDLSLDKKYITDDSAKGTLVRGAQVQRYLITNEISQGEILYLLHDEYLANVSSPRSIHHKQSRLLMQGITGVNERVRLKMTLVESGIFCANSVNYILPPESYSSIEYILGLLNSKLINWFFAKLSTNSNVNGYEVDNLPIRKGASKEHIAELAAQVTEIKKTDPRTETSALEAEIDRLVYELFGLTEGEIAIVESSISQS